MAATVAAPIERHVGEIAGLSELTSVNSLGNSVIICLFDLKRNVDGAARDVQAALNAAATDLPTGLPNLPIFRKANPNNAPVMIIALSSTTMSNSAVYDAADSVMLQRLSQVSGVSEVSVAGADQPGDARDGRPRQAFGHGSEHGRCPHGDRQRQCDVARGRRRRPALRSHAADERPASHAGRLQGSRRQERQRRQRSSVRWSPMSGRAPATTAPRRPSTVCRPSCFMCAGRRTRTRSRSPIRSRTLIPQVKRFMPAGVEISVLSDRTTSIRASVDDNDLHAQSPRSCSS